MDFRQLEVFCAVARHASFTKAADDLGIAQPAVSLHIQNLEAQLRIRLIHREKRQFRLTSAGQLLLAEGEHLLREFRRLEDRLGRTARGFQGRLRVGFLASATAPFLPALACQFRMEHPDVELILREFSPREQIEALVGGDLDLGLSRPAPERFQNVLDSKEIYRDRLVLVVPQSHRLADQAFVRLRELELEPAVLYRRSEAPDLVDAMYAVCSRAGFSPVVHDEAATMTAVLLMVAAEVGWSLVPRCTQFLRQPGVRLVELADGAPEIPLCVIQPQPSLNIAAGVFRESLLRMTVPIDRLMEAGCEPVSNPFGPGCPILAALPTD